MNISSSLFAKIATLLLVFSSITLPSGSIYNANIKIYLSFVIFPLCIIIVIKKGIEFRHLIAIFGVTFFLLLFTTVGILNNIPIVDIKTHAIAFLSLISVIFPSIYLVHKKVISTDILLHTIYFSVIIETLLKGAVILYLIQGHSLVATKIEIEDIFGVSFIGLETNTLYRINLPIDYILPLILYLSAPYNRFKKNTNHLLRLTVFILAFISVVLSYSRYLWIYSLIAIFLPLFFKNTKSINSSTFFIIPALFFLLILFSLMPYDFFIDRFTGEFAHSSDETRKMMFPAILDTFYKHPVLGLGLGSSTKGFTNIAEVPWYYELQWLAFAMQFGTLGLLVLFFTSVIFIWFKATPINSLHMISIRVLYIFWISVGFVNGFMLTSSGATIFLAFYLAAYTLYKT